MDTTTLMEKLLAIERAVGQESHEKVHELVNEAQDCLRALEEELERTGRKVPHTDRSIQ